MKKLLITVTVIVFAIICNKSEAQTTGWTLHSNVNNIEMYYQILNCSGPDNLLLKIINNDSSSRTIEYFVYGIIPGYNVTLSPGQILEGVCGQLSDVLVEVPAGLAPDASYVTIDITY